MPFDLFGRKTLKKAEGPAQAPPAPDAGLDMAALAQQSAAQKLPPKQVPARTPGAMQPAVPPKKKTTSQLMSGNLMDFEG